LSGTKPNRMAARSADGSFEMLPIRLSVHSLSHRDAAVVPPARQMLRFVSLGPMNRVHT
jgi:hypothetical protein